MDELIEKMATAMSPALWSSGRPDSEVGPGTRDARNCLRRNAREALRVLTEHGDTQQVRERVAEALWTAFREDSGFVEAVMAVVAPIVAARDTAVERAEHKSRLAAENHYRAERAEADLAAANRKLDQVRALANNYDRVITRERLLAMLGAK
jgi:hypothetical protein